MKPLYPPGQRGLFIVFEGIDGSGTTTVSRRVHERMGGDSLWTNEPSDSEYGNKARHLLQVPGTQPIQLAMLFALDRWHHLRHVILPALEANRLVLCDRFLLSSLAYQQQDGIERGIVEKLSPTYRPDLTIFLRCKVEVAEQRRQGRGLAADRFEVTERQRQIALNYEQEVDLLQCSGDPVAVIDGEQDLKEVVEQCYGAIVRAMCLPPRNRGR